MRKVVKGMQRGKLFALRLNELLGGFDWKPSPQLRDLVFLVSPNSFEANYLNC